MINNRQDKSSTIHIRRNPHFIGVAVKFKVFINGIEVGGINVIAREVQFSTRAGENEIQIKTIFKESKILTIETNSDETTFLECGMASMNIYLKDPSSKSSDDQLDNELNTIETYETWAMKRWYVFLICILAGTYIVGFGVGTVTPGTVGGCTAGTGVAVGFGFNYLIYRISTRTR